MKRFLPLYIMVAFLSVAQGQRLPLKIRPDAFPPRKESSAAKESVMALTVEDMSSWDRYPTYDVYLDMMTHWAEKYATVCHVDTIGRTIQGRLILSMFIDVHPNSDRQRPGFFYSSSMHGDELTGYVMMLRLIDTLLSGYGKNEWYTHVLDNVRVSINPLSNPDGAYFGGDSTVVEAIRYNANAVDLNRNFPDPFGTEALDELQVENKAMIDYVSKHRFALSANLHGGSEVMNYPWDSFSSSQQRHPLWQWWEQVCRRFVDTCRRTDRWYMSDVCSEGFIEGGDWYVIPNGRQDYMNFFLNCRELTIELSTEKVLNARRLPKYWEVLNKSLVGYIEETANIPKTGITSTENIDNVTVYPNPVHETLFIEGTNTGSIDVVDMKGNVVKTIIPGTRKVDVGSWPRGLYILRHGSWHQTIVKQK